jgi:hypothetical protein
MRFWRLMDDMVADEHVPVGILKSLHFSAVWIDVAPTVHRMNILCMSFDALSYPFAERSDVFNFAPPAFKNGKRAYLNTSNRRS